MLPDPFSEKGLDPRLGIRENSPFYPMKKYIAIFVCASVTAAVVFGQAGEPTPANASLLFSDLSNALSGTYAPGNTFTLNVSLNYGGTDPANADGISYWLESLTSSNASAPGIFSITSRILSTWTDPQTDPFTAQAIDGSDGNSDDLGASGSAQTAGTFELGRLTFSIDANAAPGTYKLQDITTGENFNKGAVLSGSDGVFDLPASIYTVNITAVPEPSTWLAGMGAAGVIGITMLHRRQTTQKH